MSFKVSGDRIFFSSDFTRSICHLANFAKSSTLDVNPAAAAIPSALKKFTFSLSLFLFSEEYPNVKFFP